MNRETKFRGKTKDGQWITGNYHRAIGKGILCNHDFYGKIIEREIDFDCHWILQPQLPDYSGWSIKDSFRDYGVIKESIGQYVGVNDKHGAEVCEGDILKCYDHPTNIESGVFEVKYILGCFVAGNMPVGDWGRAWIEIIGNKFDNNTQL
jgi:hypothetical protein